ncbi:hypothetical protein CA51_21150 [Rosistilla oblonga]|uniref:hypothetical protein n=1 Tax=Rosistilla oblonga TaxID=2527990 RepID=UPI0011888BC0|nr:hypothetical protein [Rosistilla oblonga]QDV12234.1 hypothetical protein CA51_21150 [Rosistilla oblonga]
MGKKKSSRKNSKTYYHVTAVENVSRILARGLKGTTEPRNRGEGVDCPTIFALDSSDEQLTDAIARSQIWPCQDINDYAVIEIKASGIAGHIIEDDTAESTANSQWMIQQSVIAPEFLSHAKTREYNFPGKALLALTRDLTRRPRWKAEEWEIAIEHTPAMFVMARLEIEIDRSQMHLTDEQWSIVDRSFRRSELAVYRKAMEEKCHGRAARSSEGRKVKGKRKKK